MTGMGGGIKTAHTLHGKAHAMWLSGSVLEERMF